MHTLFAASLVEPQRGKYLRLSPIHATRSILRENVEINGLHERVKIIDQAVGASESPSSTFQYFPQHPAMSGFVVSEERIQSFMGTPETIEVSTTTLDALLSPLGDQADLVKIDVEGFELQVLQGATRVLAASPDTAFLIEHSNSLIASVLGGDAVAALWRIINENRLLVFAVGGPTTHALRWETFAAIDGDLVLVHAGSRPHRALLA